jgi:hypothetical protein
LLDVGRRPRGEIGAQQPRNTRPFRVREKAIDPVGEQRIEIRHEHHRHAERRLPHQLEHTADRHPSLQHGLGGALDGEPVGERIAEGDPHLDHIGADPLGEP